MKQLDAWIVKYDFKFIRWFKNWLLNTIKTCSWQLKWISQRSFDLSWEEPEFKKELCSRSASIANFFDWIGIRARSKISRSGRRLQTCRCQIGPLASKWGLISANTSQGALRTDSLKRKRLKMRKLSKAEKSTEKVYLQRLANGTQQNTYKNLNLS